LSSLSKELSMEKHATSMTSLLAGSMQSGEIRDLLEFPRILLIDDEIVECDQKCEFLIKNFYLSERFSTIFTENTDVRLKLKLNLREYLYLTNEGHPGFVKLDTDRV
jgi:hypothetical protein